MAGIKSNIILNDNMSAVLRDIKNNVESCLKAMGDMEKGGEKAFDDSEMRDFKETLKQVTRGLDNVESELKQAGNAADDNSGKFEKLGGVLKGVGKVAKVMGTAAVSGLTAAGAAVGKITKDAVESYSNYEQLVGGVETLFGNGGLTLKQFAKQEGQTVAAARSQYKELTAAQNEALKNANDAYKTAGMSANEYMEVSTGFAASLVSSLGGDTNKAVKYADMAVIDMADNANKMGSDISSIQYAYQGFAKQNYTMLDNLKLGYGGTAREMARLVNDSGVLGSKKIDLDDTKELGNALSEVGFAKITEAIHEVQKEMGIFETTKNEAEGTIQGSMSMMKASWQNMLTALVTGGDQYEQCVQNLVNSVTVFGKNILPVVEQALNGVGNLISDLAPIIAEKLPGILENILPNLLTAATNIFSALGDALPGLLQALVAELPSIMTVLTDVFDSILSTLMTLMPEIIPVVVDALLSLVDSIITNLPLFIDAAVQLITALVQGLADAAPTLIPAMVTAIIAMVNGLIQNLPLLLTAALELIQALADGLIESLPVLIAALPQLILGLVSFFQENTSTIMEAGIVLITALIDALPEIIAMIVEVLPEIIYGIVNGLLQNLDEIISAGLMLFSAILTAIPEIIVLCRTAVIKIVKGIIEKFREKWDDMKEAGKQLLKGLWNGISDAVGWVIERVKGVGSRIMNAIKGVFGIHSPSKEFAMIGDYLMQGLGNGVTDNAKYAISATQSVARDVLDAAGNMSANAQIGATFTGVTGSMSDFDGGTYDIMRNYAAQDSVNKFTTAQINIDMGGITNQIADGNDVDELITRFVDGVRERLSTASQGVH